MGEQTCATCRWFKEARPEQHMTGGWCQWRAPMNMRRILLGRSNEHIPSPEKETCACHAERETKDMLHG